MIDQQTSLVVGLSESLPEVLGRLRKSPGASVSIEIPAASSLFLTASEFRALHAAADRDHIAVTVATDDPLRQQLAALFKLPVSAPAGEAKQGSISDESAPSETTSIERDSPRSDGDAPSATENHVAVDTSSPVVRRGRLGSRPIRRATAAPGQPTVTANTAQDAIAEDAPSRIPRALAPAIDRLSATTRRQRLIAAGAFAGVVVLAYLGAFLFLTKATVVLTLKRQPISQDLTIAVAAPGVAPSGGANVTLAATPVSFALTSSQTMDVTGVKTVGDAPARGTVSLSNPTGKKVTIEAGTELEDKITGTRYAIDQTVEVPAGKDGAPGFGQAAVTSLEPGSAGNREVGLLSGQLANGIYFSNREAALGGGTDKQIPVVTQADLDTLQDRVTTDLMDQAAGQAVEGDLVVLAPSIQLTQTAFTPDHQVDDESATVTMQASAQVTALAYVPGQLSEQVAAALTATVPAGYEVDPTTLRLSEPAVANGDQQSVLLDVHVDGSARAVMSPQDRQTIADEIAGGDKSDAASYLGTLPAVDRFEIRYSPGWLPDRIPTSADRVEIEAR